MSRKKKQDTVLAGTDLAKRDTLETERQRTVDALKLAESAPVETAEQRDKLSGWVSKSAERVKELEAERKLTTDPLNAELKLVNGWYKPVRDAHEAFQRAAKARIQARLEELKAAQDAALAQIEAGAGQAPDEAFAIAHQPVETPAGMTTRTVREVQVVYPEMIPRTFLLPNLELIEAEFKAGRDVAGCIWVERDQLVRARS